MIQPLCQWFWNKVDWNKTPPAFIRCPQKRNVQNCWGLWRWIILWHISQGELQETMGQHVNGTVCYETTGKVWTCHPCKTTTLSVFGQRHSVWKGQSNTDAKQWQSIIRRSRQKVHLTNCPQLPLLCTSSWYYNSDGIIWSLFTTVSTNQKHNETSKPIHWLLEPSRTGMYARYPYQELHGYSTLIVWLLSDTIPVTWHRSHVFPRGVISQDHYKVWAGERSCPFPLVSVAH